MTDQTISDEVALRIGVAARALPDTDVPRLLMVLDDAIGLPPTTAKLEGLTIKSLKTAADGELVDIDSGPLKFALSLLKGEGADDIEPLPDIEPYTEGDLPGSIRVACASNGAELLDGHFGSCRRFLVYQISGDTFRLIDIRDIDNASPTARDDKNAYRASLIRDCQVLCVASIGGPAAAKVVKLDIHPIKFTDGGSARERIAALSAVLADKVPPWLAKIMGQDADQRVRFERDTEDA
ncbi:MAG: dinitrogenase iron-molybdenum cofactor biosynthesis protein [Thiohalocapsa sp.]